ncbi:hypothetical protein [Tsuneonella rigui]|uniref:hypothetical protein n=1 Tax=Tsuneonella rigui TaxID=1708790 RepID=UPI000F7E933C|nr:hypothetical protein [Tsuneonella rigui]
MRWLAALAAATLAAGPLAAQEEPDPKAHPAEEDAKLDKMLERAERDRGAARTDKLSRVALEDWAGCLARKNVGEATRVLKMDFTSPTYDRALKMLSEEVRACIGFRGTLRAGGLLFAGEMAEALLESDGIPIGTALARAAASPATKGFSFTDKVAICVVRSVPGDVATLFETKRDSAEEAAAIDALATPMGLCAQAAQANKPLSVSPAGLRAMLATAAFRSIRSAGTTS